MSKSYVYVDWSTSFCLKVLRGLKPRNFIAFYVLCVVYLLCVVSFAKERLLDPVVVSKPKCLCALARTQACVGGCVFLSSFSSTSFIMSAVFAQIDHAIFSLFSLSPIPFQIKGVKINPVLQRRWEVATLKQKRCNRRKERNRFNGNDVHRREARTANV